MRSNTSARESMATTLLRKIWDSVSNRSQPNRDSSSLRHSSLEDSSMSSAGPFDRIPSDILLQILKLLEPGEAARLSLVCKCWRVLVSDDRLWIFFLQNRQSEFSCDSIFFSETRLGLAYPLQAKPNHTPQLSFMRVYGLRAKVTGSVIVDGGSGYCKFGWSKYDSPSGRSATFLEFGNIETPLLSRLQHFFATIYGRMQVKPSTQPIVVSLPICHYDVLNGKVMREVGVEVAGLGALKLTGFLKEQMQQRNMDFESLYTVRTLKENLCYVAVDYEAELSKDTNASFKVSESWFTLSNERFKTGEILFQPRIAGVCAMGLHQAVALCMDHCQAAELTADHGWFKTVVLAGGTACLPGLAERLEKEVRVLLPSFMANGIRVIPPPYGADSAWFGAKLISNLSTFPGPWCMTKKQFRQKCKRRHSLMGPW
ncbi:actin-related protein 8 isoform X2 [Malania oleifera]|uniref:actin-related protein 8 isoform X2 n=1 Tax=Malania oleifera TaxID=397392 RepID=UPI0025AE237B|nr:actin-related protein 8 isoform X2 [Malania oleifera]